MKIRSQIILVLVLAGLTSITPVVAQIGGGMDETTRTDLGGRNFIVGTIFEPSGFPITTRMRIRLTSLDLGKEILASSDDHGKFVFSGLAPGSYMIYLDDDGTGEYEAASQSV